MECCVQDHHGDAASLYIWLRNKTPSNVQQWIESNAHFSIVALSDGKVSGFAFVSKAGEVILFYLLPEVRFMGVGKAILSAIEAQALSHGASSLRLESTGTARPFYLRNGFIEIGLPIAAFNMKCYPMTKSLSIK